MESLLPGAGQEWEVRPPDRWTPPWRALMPPSADLRVAARMECRTPADGIPAPEPYFVDGWQITWAGNGPMPAVPAPPRSWRVETRRTLSTAGIEGTASVHAVHGSARCLHRIQWRGVTTASHRGFIRQLGRLLPLEETWWSEETSGSPSSDGWQAVARRALTWGAAATAEWGTTEAVGPAGTWLRWPIAGRHTALWSHSAWPEQAFVLYHRGQGPYLDRLSWRWTLTGPRVERILGRTSPTGVGRLLHSTEGESLSWWARIASGEAGQDG